MSQYEVVFEANNTTRTLGHIEEVKGGNNFLQCFGEVNGDDQLLAKIPFDAVCYIAHQDVQMSTAITKTSDGSQVHNVTELVTTITE